MALVRFLHFQNAAPETETTPSSTISVAISFFIGFHGLSSKPPDSLFWVNLGIFPVPDILSVPSNWLNSQLMDESRTLFFIPVSLLALFRTDSIIVTAVRGEWNIMRRFYGCGPAVSLKGRRDTLHCLSFP